MSIRELKARGLRWVLIDTRSGKVATVAKNFDEVDAFPFTPREWAIVDIKREVAFNDSEGWNYIPESWDLQE